MKSKPYTPQHMVQRVQAVRNLWIKDYERERRGKIKAIIPTVTAYSIGFWSGSLGHGKGFWLITVGISISMWYLFRYFRAVYKIPI